MLGSRVCFYDNGVQMNLDEIKNLKADRETDALIAWHVFGEFSTPYNTGNGTRNWDDEHVKHFSTEISAAWEVVEKLAHDGILIRIDVCESCGNLIWWCSMGEETEDGEHIKNLADIRMVENSAPLTICRAALLAVIGDK